MAKSSSLIPSPGASSSTRVSRFYVIYDRDISGGSENPCSFTCIVLDKEFAETTRLTISPHPDTVNPLPVLSGFTSVALGSNIFMIGGFCHLGLCPDQMGRRLSFHPHSHVRFFNALRPQDGYKELAPMHLSRIRPAAVVIYGKIYVFGGLQREDPEDGEYFDPDTNQWHRFHSPGCRTSFPLIQAQHVDPEGARGIIVYSDCSQKLLSYPLETRKWEIVGEEFGQCHRPGAILDGVIYSVLEEERDYKKVRLHGYDLIQKRWFLVEMPEGVDDGTEICYVTAWVFASGSDRLCLLWFRNGRDERAKMIECLELGISKVYSDDSSTGSGGMLKLTGTVVSRTYFPDECLDGLESILTF